MKTVVLIQLVPDLVEDLYVDADEVHLDPMCVRWVVNEFDDYAIEQAILLKERVGGTVTVVAPNVEGADEVLFSAAARGADELVLLTGDFEGETNNHAMARCFAGYVKKIKYDLLLTGVQNHFRHDGQPGAILAEELGLPYVGYVTGMTLADGKVTVGKEYPGGMIAMLEASLPAVIGIQAPDTPMRYVPVSKLRQAMKTSRIQEEDAVELVIRGGARIRRMYTPLAANRATMIDGDVDQVADELVTILKAQDVL